MEKIIMDKFQTKLKVLRAEHNLTQEDVANKVGVVRQTIAYIERGDYMPSLGLAWRIAKLFHSTIDNVFIFEKDEKGKQ